MLYYYILLHSREIKNENIKKLIILLRPKKLKMILIWTKFNFNKLLFAKNNRQFATMNPAPC